MGIAVVPYQTSTSDASNVWTAQSAKLSLIWDDVMFGSDGCAVKDVS